MKKIDIGATAEYAFASELLSRGITPCWPSTETGAYDMVADTAKGLKRVQVKGTQGVGPSVRMCISRKSGRYKVSEVDLVVLYLFEYTTWYLIPIRKVRRDIVIKPGDPKCRWNRFKEAWHLLA